MQNIINNYYENYKQTISEYNCKSYTKTLVQGAVVSQNHTRTDRHEQSVPYC